MFALLRVTTQAPTGLIYDKRKEKWELLEEGCQLQGEPALELASFLQGEDYVNGQLMRSRSLEMGGRTGQYHAERVLAQAEAIPAEWRKYYLVFPDTLWRTPDESVCVPCLHWHGGKWVLLFFCIDATGWGDCGRVVRLRS